MTIEERVVKLINETETSYENDALIKRCMEFTAKMDRMGLINRNVYPAVMSVGLNQLQAYKVLMPTYPTTNIPSK